MSLAKQLLNNPGLKALIIDDEVPEINSILLGPKIESQKPYKSFKKGIVKLKYVGKQEFPGVEPIRLWDIKCVGHPFHDSTRSLEGLKELGIIE